MLQDQVNEWANMTGFLSALGGVCLQSRSVRNRYCVRTFSDFDLTLLAYVDFFGRLSMVIMCCVVQCDDSHGAAQE